MIDSGIVKAGILSLPGPLGLILGGANTFNDTEGIARARAALMIAKASGSLSEDKIENLEELISKDAEGNFIVDQDGKGLGFGTGINYANSFAKSLGFDSVEDVKENKDEFNKTLKSRKTGFVGVMGDMTAQERKDMIDKANKEAQDKFKADQADKKAKESGGSSSDDSFSAANMMKERLDRMAKAEGQSEGFSGSVTSGSVYAGGNRAEGGLMLKKKKRKK